MSDLAQLANRYHRGKDVAKVMTDIALPELCRAVVEHPEMSAAQRVDHALDSHMSACRVWLSDISGRMTESVFMLQKRYRPCWQTLLGSISDLLPASHSEGLFDHHVP